MFVFLSLTFLSPARFSHVQISAAPSDAKVHYLPTDNRILVLYYNKAPGPGSVQLNYPPPPKYESISVKMAFGFFILFFRFLFLSNFLEHFQKIGRYIALALDGNSGLGVNAISLLLDLLQAFDQFEGGPESRRPIFLTACATCSELPSDISAMVLWKM